jgi:hypothetical protein
VLGRYQRARHCRRVGREGHKGTTWRHMASDCGHAAAQKTSGPQRATHTDPSVTQGTPRMVAVSVASMARPSFGLPVRLRRISAKLFTGTRHRLSGLRAPVRRSCFANIGDGSAYSAGRRRHSPTHPDQLALATCVAHHRAGKSGNTPGIGGRLPTYRFSTRRSMPQWRTRLAGGRMQAI